MPRAMKSKGTEGGSTGQPENTRGSDMKEDEGASWYVCQSGWIPASASTAGELCTCWVSVWQRERAPAVFTRRVDARLPSVRCALVIPRTCLREPDNKIWAPLGRSWQKLTSPPTQWCDPKSLRGVTSHNLSRERARGGRFNPLSAWQLYAIPACFGLFAWWMPENEGKTQKRRNDIKVCAPPVSRGRSQDVNQSDGAERGETVWDRWGLKGEDTNSPSSSELLSFRSKDVETFKVWSEQNSHYFKLRKTHFSISV